MATSKIDRAKIMRCTKSNIQEAWCGFYGTPFTFNKTFEDDYSASVNTAARKHLPDLVREPALIIQPGAPLEIAPIWTRQFAWNERKRFARIGRRYLSVHRVCSPPTDRYSSFESDIIASTKPWIESICGINADTSELRIASVGAGYVNRFAFAANGFRMDRYFNLNLGFKASREPGEVFVSNMLVSFGFLVPSKGLRVELSLSAVQPNSKKNELVVITNVSCRREVKADTASLAKGPELIAEVREAQKEAKAQFYAFCTDETLTEVLGAE